jgi:large subunit ribosomal protein L21
MTLAVIRTGGKQYLVTPGQKIKIEKIEKKEGSEIVFPEVLFLKRGKTLEIGTPLVKGVKVYGKVLRHGKAQKVIIFKFKAKKRYKLKKGHRQPFSEIEITKIGP